MSHTKENNQSIETYPELKQVLELAVKDNKSYYNCIPRF